MISKREIRKELEEMLPESVDISMFGVDSIQGVCEDLKKFIIRLSVERFVAENRMRERMGMPPYKRFRFSPSSINTFRNNLYKAIDRLINGDEGQIKDRDTSFLEET